MIKKFILASILTASASFAFAQDKEKEDETKMIREVISVQADKSLFTDKTPPPAPAKNGKKHTQPPPEPAAPDTSNPLIPAPAFELAKRAQNWSNDKPAANSRYSKINCSANGNMATCQATFVYKVKELNPTEKVDGEITMTITVESKEGKYRYTVNNIRHKASLGDASGGDIYATVAECGSMKISDLTWKKIKSAAFADAKIVTDDLKAMMDKPSGETVKKDDW